MKLSQSLFAIGSLLCVASAATQGTRYLRKKTRNLQYDPPFMPAPVVPIDPFPRLQNIRVHFDHADSERGAHVSLLRRNAENVYELLPPTNPRALANDFNKTCDVNGCRMDVHTDEQSDDDAWCSQFAVEVVDRNGCTDCTFDPSTLMEVTVNGAVSLSLTNGFQSGFYSMLCPPDVTNEEEEEEEGPDVIPPGDEEDTEDPVIPPEEEEEGPGAPPEEEEEAEPKSIMNVIVEVPGKTDGAFWRLRRNSKVVRKAVVAGASKRTVSYEEEGKGWCEKMTLQLLPAKPPVKNFSENIKIRVTLDGKKVFETKTKKSQSTFSFKCPY